MSNSVRPHDERLEVPREEIGQVVGAGLLLLHRVPRVVAGQEAVAVGARAAARRRAARERRRARRRCRNRRTRRRRGRSVPSARSASRRPRRRSAPGVEWSFAGRHLTSTCVHPLSRITASTSRAIAPHARMSTSGRSAASNATSRDVEVEHSAWAAESTVLNSPSPQRAAPARAPAPSRPRRQRRGSRRRRRSPRRTPRSAALRRRARCNRRADPSP